MITNLKEMMIERLTLFKSKNRKLPERILVYRDGVSEVRKFDKLVTPQTHIMQGQFNIVRLEELPEILKAIHHFDNGPKESYRPKLTIVICGKRHHTRFYPTERTDAAPDGNPLPGTVVDRGVTAVYDFDFFLQGMWILILRRAS